MLPYAPRIFRTLYILKSLMFFHRNLGVRDMESRPVEIPNTTNKKSKIKSGMNNHAER